MADSVLERTTRHLKENKFQGQNLLSFDDLRFIEDIDLKRLNFFSNAEKLKDLGIGMVNLSNLIIFNRVDTLVLMDKSARPVAQLLKNLWRESYPNSELPDIRFVNVGKEEDAKDENEELLTKLFKAHAKSFDNKTILVADEVVYSGRSIARAHDVIKKVFGDSPKKLIFTAVGERTPEWYSVTDLLGVYDVDFLDFLGKPLQDKLKNEDPDSHIAKSIQGVIRKHGESSDEEYHQSINLNRQRKVNEFRHELSYIAKKIAGSCTEMLDHTFKPVPRLYSNIDQKLNTPS